VTIAKRDQKWAATPSFTVRILTVKLFHKPFDLKSLLETIKQALSAKAA
jgi:hypothetical protein